MATNDLVEHIVEKLTATARAVLSPEEVGWLITSYPVVGGGIACIVLSVETMLVRVREYRGQWVAEHLVVRGER